MAVLLPRRLPPPTSETDLTSGARPRRRGLAQRSRRGPVGPGCFPRGSPLGLVRWRAVRGRVSAAGPTVAVPYGVPLSGCSWGRGARTDRVERSSHAPISWKFRRPSRRLSPRFGPLRISSASCSSWPSRGRSLGRIGGGARRWNMMRRPRPGVSLRSNKCPCLHGALRFSASRRCAAACRSARAGRHPPTWLTESAVPWLGRLGLPRPSRDGGAPLARHLVTASAPRTADAATECRPGRFTADDTDPPRAGRLSLRVQHRDRVRSCPPPGACRRRARSAGTRCPSDWLPAVRGV